MILEIFESKHAKDLSNILNSDTKLRPELELESLISEDDFLAQTNTWILNNNSESFAIMQDQQAIGLISLSHIKQNEKSARIGYWLASSYWNQGIGTRAFEAVLQVAKNKKLKSVSATIPESSIASLKIWQKFGATLKLNNNNYSACLEF